MLRSGAGAVAAAATRALPASCSSSIRCETLKPLPLEPEGSAARWQQRGCRDTQALCVWGEGGECVCVCVCVCV